MTLDLTQQTAYVVTGMRRYAYEVGYERGFAGRLLRPYPDEAGSHLRPCLKAGYRDGLRDRQAKNPYQTSFNPSETT